jgi:hypothetical protein
MRYFWFEFFLVKKRHFRALLKIQNYQNKYFIYKLWKTNSEIRPKSDNHQTYQATPKSGSLFLSYTQVRWLIVTVKP